MKVYLSCCVALFGCIWAANGDQEQEISGKLAAQQALLEELQQVTTELMAGLTRQEQELRAVGAALDDAVPLDNTTRNAFMAIHSTTQSLSTNSRVQFNTARLNERPSTEYGYDTNRAAYRCPVDGEYAFYVNIRTYSSSSQHEVALVKGTQSGPQFLTATYCYNYSGYYKSCSAMALVSCARNEEVYVQALRGFNLYSNTLGYTHFGGFRVF